MVRCISSHKIIEDSSQTEGLSACNWHARHVRDWFYSEVSSVFPQFRNMHARLFGFESLCVYLCVSMGVVALWWTGNLDTVELKGGQGIILYNLYVTDV